MRPIDKRNLIVNLYTTFCFIIIFLLGYLEMLLNGNIKFVWVMGIITGVSINILFVNWYIFWYNKK